MLVWPGQAARWGLGGHATFWRRMVVFMGGGVTGVDRTAEAEFSGFMHSRWLQLVRLGFALTGDRGLAEDLAQTALARAYASWPKICRSGDPDAYVRQVLVNANRSRYRKHRVAEQLTGTVPEPVPQEVARDSDDRVMLMAALLSLPPRQRSVVVLRFWLDMTEAQVAEALGCSVGNVKSQASRALATLRARTDLTEEMS
jgi:RNA polymerase sigma-70 factor (sigma-E family)